MSQDNQNLIAVLPYLLEVERQCQLALGAADRMSDCAEAFWPLAEPVSVIGDFFDHAQRLMSSAAVIGKILYAKGEYRAERARKLRALLGVGDSSPLASWKVRDAFEHIDERIDRWVKRNPGASSYASCGISRTGQSETNASLRSYDSKSDVLRVWDAEAELQPIVEAIRGVNASLGAHLRRTPGT